MHRITHILTASLLMISFSGQAWAQKKSNSKDHLSLPPKTLGRAVNGAPGFEAEPGFDGVRKASPQAAVRKAHVPPVKERHASLDALALARHRLNLKKASVRTQIRKKTRLVIKNNEIPQSAAVRGNFLHVSKDIAQHMVFHPGRYGAQLFVGSKRYAFNKRIHLVNTKELKALGAKQNAVPLDLILDGSTQVLIWRTVKTKNGRTIYKMSLVKVFGKQIGLSFDHVVGYKHPKTGKIVRTSVVEFLRHTPHHKIRTSPIDSTGHILSNQAKTMEWNHWQGVFTMPKVAPTAPKRNTT